jgi:hypothetical protein
LLYGGEERIRVQMNDGTTTHTIHLILFGTLDIGCPPYDLRIKALKTP